MDQDLEEIERQVATPSPAANKALLSLIVTVIMFMSLILMMLGEDVLDNGDQRGWWMVGLCFVLPEVSLFYFLRFVRVFDGATPRHWALPDRPLAPVISVIAMGYLVFVNWQGMSLIPPWSVPPQGNLSSVTGVLAQTECVGRGRHCEYVGQVQLSGGRMFQFTCTPGHDDDSCVSDGYLSWTGKPVVVDYFTTENYKGPGHVVVDLKSASSSDALVTYNQRMPQLANDLIRYNNEAAHPNFWHIWLVLCGLGGVATAVLRRVPDEPDHQY